MGAAVIRQTTEGQVGKHPFNGKQSCANDVTPHEHGPDIGLGSDGENYPRYGVVEDKDKHRPSEDVCSMGYFLFEIEWIGRMHSVCYEIVRSCAIETDYHNQAEYPGEELETLAVLDVSKGKSKGKDSKDDDAEVVGVEA